MLYSKSDFRFSDIDATQGFDYTRSFNFDCRPVLRAVKVFALAESLGGVESLIGHPLSLSHASMEARLREKAGITENLIRLTVGDGKYRGSSG